jgi:hypothetical protein
MLFKAFDTLGQQYKKKLSYLKIPHNNLTISIFCRVHMPTQKKFLKLVLAKHISKYLLSMVSEGEQTGKNVNFNPSLIVFNETNCFVKNIKPKTHCNICGSLGGFSTFGMVHCNVFSLKPSFTFVFCYLLTTS